MSQTDSDSTDSDDGVRFKTVNVRKKGDNYDSSKINGNKSRSPSPVRPIVGPVLPPHLIKQSIDIPNVEKKTIGPILPSDLVAQGPSRTEDVSIGPQLPAHLQRKLHKEKEEKNCDMLQEAYIGPQLPPHLRQKLNSVNVHEKLEGPSLSPQTKEIEAGKQISIGPFLPPHLRDKLQKAQSSDEDDDIYGPVPDNQQKMSKTQIALEERALQLKLDKLLPSTQKLPDREEWMLELPEVKAANFGLGPRQFRAKPRPDFSDRSSWTDTPNNKTKKEEKIDLKKEVELKEMKRKDEEQEKISRKHKKKTDSLLEIHQSKLKKQKKVV